MCEVIANWEEKSFPLVEAAKELKAADAAYRKMIQIGVHSFHEYERAWRDFLHCIDRAWNKTCAEAKGRKNWKRLESEFVNLRRTDPLLRYLVHARNVSEHTTSPLLKEWQPNFKVAQVSNNLLFDWDEWDRPLIPVTDRGTLFNPPKKHLGKPWSHYRRKGVSEPRTAAELAMKFYVDVVVN